MQQIFFEVLLPILFSFLMVGVSFLIGNFVFIKLKVNSYFGNLFNFSVSTILGFGLVANLSLLLSLLNILNIFVVWSVVGVVLFIGRKKVVNLLSKLLIFLKNFRITNFWEGLFLFLIVGSFLFYLVSTFSPPYLNDAISYHLPDTIEIANGNLLSMGGYGKWNENMPILMETLYAWLYRMGGFTLINISHYQMVLLLLLAIYSIIKNEFSRLSGLLTVVLIFGFHALLTHSVDSYIYGGLMAYEITGILLFLLWVKYKENGLLILSGIMYGLALACKYTPLYSFAAITIFFLFINFRNRISKKQFIFSCLYFFVPIFLICSFWYIKNFIFLHNPFYPFIFNHKGLNEEFFERFAFDSRYATGKPLVEVGIKSFLLLPYKFFWSPYYITTLTSFLFFPFGLLVSQNRSFIRLLMFFTIIYFFIWHFFISNVIFYGLPGPILLSMVGGITITWLMQNKFKFVFENRIFKILAILLLCLVALFVISFKNNHVIGLKLTEVKYALGIINKEEFYRRNELGEIFEVSNFINNSFSNTKVLNNWDGFNAFLQKGNKYVWLSNYMSDGGDISKPALCRYFRDNNIFYIFIDYNFRERAMAPDWNRQYHPEYNIGEKIYLLENEVIVPSSTVIFEKYSGKLYQINYCK